MNFLTQIFLLSFCVLNVCPASAQTEVPKPAPTKTKVEMAVWDEKNAEALSISREDFRLMGLSKLTLDEYRSVIAWGFKREGDGRAEVLASSTTYTCGPTPLDVKSLSKVKIVVESDQKTPNELMSGIRQRLRNISDVQIVFDKNEADLIVSINGYENRTQSGTTRLGYTASTVTMSPCTWRTASQTGTFFMYEGSHLSATGGDADGLVTTIVTGLDSQEIEAVRAQNAYYKKVLQNPTK